MKGGPGLRLKTVVVILLIFCGAALLVHGLLVPSLEGKVARDRKPTAYVCEQGLCKLPTTKVEVFAKQLAQPVTPAAGNGAAR